MHRSNTRIFQGVALTSVLGLVLAGCANHDASNASANSGTEHGKVGIVATTTQICDYVTQIAAGAPATAGLVLEKTGADGQKTTIGSEDATNQTRLELTCLLAPNASAHEHELTPSQATALAQADLLLVSGVDLEHFLDRAIEASGFKGTMGVTSGILTSKEVTDPQAITADDSLPYTVERGTQKVEVRKWPFPPAEGETEPEFIYDPHVWTSPKNAAVQVANIGEFLKEVAPDSAAGIEESVSVYADKLRNLDQWVQDSINSVPADSRILFSSHDAFGYFSKDYGIDFIGAALSDFNEQQDATAEHIQEAAQTVIDSGAKALFAENSNNSKSIEKIAELAGVKAVIGDDALYGDSLGPAGSPGETYIGSIIHNVTTIVTAWDGTLAELPDNLK